MNIARLRSLAKLNTECRANGLRSLVALEHLEGWTGALVSGVDLPLTEPADAGIATVEPGDVLFGKLRPYLAKSWLADREVYASTELLCLRPVAGINPRWLAYVMKSRPLVEWAIATSDGTKMPRTSWEKLREYRTWLPDEPTQRAIADVLDRQTARIDALVGAKRRMMELISEKEGLIFVRSLADRGLRFPRELEPDWSHVEMPVGWRVMRLSQCLSKLTNGYVGPTRDILREDGVRYIQSLHIKDGSIDFNRRPFFVEESWHRERPRIHLQPGDVLIVQTGDIGQIAVVPDGFGEASCHALQIARVRQDYLSGKFLGEYLRSPFGYQSLLSRATGALHPHLEGGIRDVPIVVPPLKAQAEILRDVAIRRLPIAQLGSVLRRQTDLLREHRQALIAAAVTGQSIPEMAA